MAKIDAIDIPTLTFQEGSAPSTPASTKWKVYTKTTGLFYMDDAGAETGPLSAGGALGAWADYTPTWTTNGTAPAIGNGTLTGRKKALDANTYLFRLRFIAGTTTTYGTGAWTFTLPATCAAGRHHVYGTAFDSSAGARLNITGFADGSGTTLSLILPEGANSVTNTTPWTWATGDELDLSGFFEV